MTFGCKFFVPFVLYGWVLRNGTVKKRKSCFVADRPEVKVECNFRENRKSKKENDNFVGGGPSKYTKYQSFKALSFFIYEIVIWEDFYEIFWMTVPVFKWKLNRTNFRYWKTVSDKVVEKWIRNSTKKVRVRSDEKWRRYRRKAENFVSHFRFKIELPVLFYLKFSHTWRGLAKLDLLCAA